MDNWAGITIIWSHNEDHLLLVWQSGQCVTPGTRLRTWHQPIMHTWVQSDLSLGFSFIPRQIVCAHS